MVSQLKHSLQPCQIVFADPGSLAGCVSLCHLGNQTKVKLVVRNKPEGEQFFKSHVCKAGP